MKMLFSSSHAYRPLPSKAASTAGFRPVLSRSKFRIWRSGPSDCAQINGSSFKINSSLRSSKDCSDPMKELTKIEDGGSPQWFSPSESQCRSTASHPLLLFLPGIDGVAVGLMPHHKRLGEHFDVRCLYIPISDQTPLADLVMLVQSSIKTEYNRAPTRPIYLVGESFGASLALIVAAKSLDIDLVLILVNPATSFSKSLLPFSDMIRRKLYVASLQRIMSPIPEETVIWKLKMIDDMQIYLNSHIHVVKAQTLIITSGKNLLLSSTNEGEKLGSMLQHCVTRSVIGNSDPLFLDHKFDLARAIQSVCYYRRGASIDYISDFLPLSPSEFKKTFESPIRFLDVAVDPVMLSTVGGEIVRGLAGIPSEGPVVLVGNHMMLGMDIIPLTKLITERNIKVRGITHPVVFERMQIESLAYDVLRMSGAVPSSPTNLYRLLSLKSHVVLFPGGIREALHQKGEEYKLFWPDEPEFVRMAARFEAKIIPFCAFGEDDVIQLLLDYDDQMKIPPLKARIEELNKGLLNLRNEDEGEVRKQNLYEPIYLPKLPGRFYFLFGQPISTQGRMDVLRNKDKAQEMYQEIQTEIYKCISYLKEKGENDPYRNILPRLAYQAFHGFDSQVPTFDI